MAKTAVISARIDPQLKSSAEAVFNELGLNATQAITLFYKRVNWSGDCLLWCGYPTTSPPKRWNKPERAQDLESFNTLDDLFDDLGI